jgi:solute carrier family 35, member E3
MAKQHSDYTAPPRYRLLGGIVAWLVEFLSAVAIILCNKALMSGELNFRYPVTLTAAHFAWTAVGSALVRGCASTDTQGEGKPSSGLPGWHVVAGFVGISCGAIILSNASLLLNSVAFYQISKLLTLPFVAVIDWAEGRKAYTRMHLPIFAVVMTGVALTIRGEVKDGGSLGTLVALLSVVTTGLHQIYCGRLQARWGMSPSALLAIVSPIKAVLLFAIGPAIDAVAFGGWIGAYGWTASAALLVCLTCLLAIALNLSQYTVIRALGAGPYQAFSQLKTAAVIVLGTLLFERRLYLQQTSGALVAVCGVIALTRLEAKLRAHEDASSPPPPPPPPPPTALGPRKDDEAIGKALLPTSSSIGERTL